MYDNFKSGRRILRLFVVGSFILFYQCVTAQVYNFRSYSLEDGLSQSEVNCIFEDSRGYMWMGTAGGGLDCFDGVNFKAYTEEDGLCGDVVSAIAEDRAGELWVGTTWGGICHFNGKSFTKFRMSDGLTTNNITCMLFDNQDELFIGTSVGLSVYHNKGFTNFLKDEHTFVPIKVKCLSKDKDGNVWVGTENGLYLWKNHKLNSLTENFHQLSGNILSVAHTPAGETWVAESPNIFYKLTPSQGPLGFTIEEKVLFSGSIKTSISSACCDQRGRLWVTTLGDGIFRFSGDMSMTHFTKNNGLSSNIIASVCEDSSGDMWFGSRGEGAMKYRDDRFCYYDNVEGLREGDIFAINEDPKGNLWVGTSNSGAYIYDGKTVTGLNTNKDIAESRTSSFYFLPNGDTWIGTSHGLISYNGKVFRKIKLVDTTDKVCIRAIYKDRKGNLWIGTSEQDHSRGLGLLRMDGEKPTFFNSSNGFVDNVYSFAEDKNGRLYIGTGAGVFVYDGKDFKAVGDGLCNAYGGSLVVDPHGHVWVGTDKCIARLEGTKFTSYTVQDGLASNTVYLMNVDNNGNIWVGTNKGIDKVSVSADDKITGIKNYNRAEGFKGIECNSRATFKDKNGIIYFGTVKGLVRFDPSEDLSEISLPKVHITDVRVGFENLDWERLGDSLSPWFKLPVDHDFSYGQNHLSFDFIGISKSIPEGVKYRFMLEGFDEGWSKPGKQSSATYSNLPAGDYIFKVIACNSDGKWNEKPAEFRFRVLAPFWRTTGFIILCAVLLGVGIYYYNRLRKLQIKRRNMVLERLVKERTSELQKQKEEREVLLKEIHHRVKNNLQIVNSLINIQSANIKDPDALAVFEESKNKIKSIALIHERLYRGQDLSSIELGDYLNELLKSLIDTYSVSKEIKLVTDLKVKMLNINTIIPLGLLLNEIISNSIKYAFGNVQQCEIYIQLKAVDADTFEMIIGDNGKGFDADPFAGENTTLGLELVKILVDQLDGTIKKMPREGTYYFIRFKRAKN